MQMQQVPPKEAFTASLAGLPGATPSTRANGLRASGCAWPLVEGSVADSGSGELNTASKATAISSVTALRSFLNSIILESQ